MLTLLGALHSPNGTGCNENGTGAYFSQSVGETGHEIIPADAIVFNFYFSVKIPTI